MSALYVLSFDTTAKGNALKNVREQTPELCLAAIQYRGYALRYAKEQTYELCLEAVKQNGYTIQFVKDPLIKAQIILQLEL